MGVWGSHSEHGWTPLPAFGVCNSDFGRHSQLRASAEHPDRGGSSEPRAVARDGSILLEILIFSERLSGWEYRATLGHALFLAGGYACTPQSCVSARPAIKELLAASLMSCHCIGMPVRSTPLP